MSLSSVVSSKMCRSSEQLKASVCCSKRLWTLPAGRRKVAFQQLGFSPKMKETVGVLRLTEQLLEVHNTYLCVD